jgi:4'-phosphopantetheinyl transferase
MQVSFHDWDDSAVSRRAAASLGGDDIQVWLATTPADDTDLTAFTRTLDPDERMRAGRFSVSEPRRQFVFGRALLRQLLGACLNASPATLAFGYQPHGKPFLAQSWLDGNLRFNLSHSGRMVAIALARGREVGVDVEEVERLHDWQPLAERIFSPRERGELMSLPKTQQQEAFFNGWTRKEAYLKATGEGLTDDFREIEVTLSPGIDPKLLGLPARLGATRPWQIRAIPLPADYAGAVVFEENPAANMGVSGFSQPHV